MEIGKKLESFVSASLRLSNQINKLLIGVLIETLLQKKGEERQTKHFLYFSLFSFHLWTVAALNGLEMKWFKAQA